MTNVIRWNPLNELRTMDEQFNRWLEPFFHLNQGFTRWNPAVDVEETKESFVVRAELPGMKKEDLQIDFENGILTLRGERRFDNERKERNFHRIERSYGSFTRSFSLPGSVDPDNVTATYEDGVLELTLPKREEARPRRIEIGGTSQKQIDSKRVA